MEFHKTVDAALELIEPSSHLILHLSQPGLQLLAADLNLRP
jgi:hypothetical protein